MAITKRGDKGSALTYQEMDDNFDAITPRTSETGAVQIPAGTTGERPSGSEGQLRFNTASKQFEGFQGTVWTSVGAGGGGAGAPGPQGVQGPAGGGSGDGLQGERGIQGADGIAIQGADGGPGIQGPAGSVQGLQGTDGSDGIGVQGSTGTPGSPGAQGIAGSEGDPGVQGPAGSVQGLQGFQGLQGSPGFGGGQGVQGPAGSVQGLTGADGDPGDVGTQGFQGFQGPAGFAQGVQGIQGGDGPAGFGIQGLQGIQGGGGQGVQGDTGPAGFGAQGHQGVQGDIGPGGTGPQGVQGLIGAGTQGPIGQDGPDGPPGTQGLQGPAGSVQGIQGITGVGDEGAQGLQGLQGESITGDTGIQGNQGIQGVQALQGIQGESITGPEGSQGATGIQGDAGETGLQGVQGPAIQGVLGAQGTAGEGNQGVQGYDAAGAQGTQGIQGVTFQGIQGSEGTGGQQGVQGNQSTQGLQGARGAIGPSGGAQGTQGTEGPPGPSGGVQGVQGAQGIGSQGVQGTTFQGTQGLQGPSDGPQGPQGVIGNQGTTGAGTQGIQGVGGIQGPSDGADGNQGIQGTSGFQGSNGSFGGTEFAYSWNNSTLGGDPGAGRIAADGANLQFATELYIDDTDDSAVDIQSFLRTTDDPAGNVKGHIRLSPSGTPSQYVLYSISTVTEATGHFEISVVWEAGNRTSFTNTSDLIVSFERTGAIGTQGTQGVTGAGVQGLIGLQGIQGMQGVQGLQGISEAGTQGIQGIQGVQGFDGLGIQGDTGIQGADGLGIQGADGLGLQGLQGADGLGIQGDTGIQGLQGPTAAGAVQNLSDLGITSTAAEINTLDGYTGSVTELNYLDTLHATGVTSTEFDYLDGVTSNIQTQLDGKQTSGTYNTTIGTDTDINTSGSTIIDNIFVTDGVITSMGTRTLTLSDLGAGTLASLSTVNAATITDNSVGAAELNVSGNGTSGQTLVSDGDGTFSWTTPSSGSELSVLYTKTLDNPNPYSTSASDRFGWEVAISGNYSIVSAYQEDDAGGTGSGKAYIYDVATGTLLHTLDNPNAYSTSADDLFGSSASISGNYAIVGAYGEDDASGTGSGKAYIFDVTNGSLLHTLDNPNAYSTGTSDQFGWSVAISDNYAIVSARSEDDAGGSNSGKAYIFDVTTGSLLYTLDNPNAYSTSVSDQFGYLVAISGNYAILGSLEDDAGGGGSGKAYIYDISTFTTSTISSANYVLDNPNAYSTSSADNFARSVAISGNYAIVGASDEDEPGGSASGKAYIYDISTFTTSTISSANYVLDNPNAYSSSVGDNFGASVQISGNYAIVGAYNEDDAGGSGSGKAYIYDISTFTSSTISSANYVLDNPNAYSTSAGDNFGRRIGISGNYAIAGAYNEDDASGTSSGKAYIFKTNGSPYTYSPQEITSFAPSSGIGYTSETTSAKTGATGTVVHNLNDGAVFDHTSLSANFTANFTNVPTTNSRTISVALILTQGGTAYMPTAVQIGGVAQTILWQGGSAPSGTASGTDVVSFTLIRSSSGAWKVIGSATSYS